jgi:hypothetical protein
LLLCAAASAVAVWIARVLPNVVMRLGASRDAGRFDLSLDTPSSPLPAR